MTFNFMSRVFGIASFLLQLLFRFVFVVVVVFIFVLFCFFFFFLLNSAIVSHHLPGQSGSFFK